MTAEYLEAGTVSGAFSYKGEVRLRHACDSPEFLRRFTVLYLFEGGQYVRRAVEGFKVSGRTPVIKLEGVDSQEAATALTGKPLYFKREDAGLTEGEHFVADIVGLPVIDALTGERYGVIDEVMDMPGGKIYGVRRPNGKQSLIPAVPQFIKEIKPGEAVYVTPIEGLF